MTDELLTTFRAEVPPAGEAATKRAYARAVHPSRRRVTRRRLAVGAVALAAAVAGGLYASLGGASSNVNPQRQRIVGGALTEVQQAFGGERLDKATLDGSLLTIEVKTDEPVDGVVGPLEANILAQLADERLRAAGEEGIESVGGPGLGETALWAYPRVARLPAGACDIPSGATFANVTAASGRIVPLLGGFCAIRLTTSDPKTFAGGVEATLNQLWRAVPAARTHERAVVVEADDEEGVPVIVAAWEPVSGVAGGAVYVRPGFCTPLVDAPVGVACGGGFDPGGAFYATIDWAHPGGRDRTVSTIREAAKHLTFQPVLPPGLGRPEAMAVDPETGGRSQLDVAFGRHASGGVHWLVERLSRDTTTKTLAEYARECRTIRGCEGSWQMVRLDDGNRGLLIEGPARTTTAVDWVEHGIYFSVVGPSKSFSSRDAKSIANTVVAGAARRG